MAGGVSDASLPVDLKRLLPGLSPFNALAEAPQCGLGGAPGWHPFHVGEAHAGADPRFQRPPLGVSAAAAAFGLSGGGGPDVRSGSVELPADVLAAAAVIASNKARFPCRLRSKRSFEEQRGARPPIE